MGTTCVAWKLIGSRLQAIKVKLQQQQQHVNELIKHMYAPAVRPPSVAKLTTITSDDVTKEGAGQGESQQ